jgi:cytochrome c553
MAMSAVNQQASDSDFAAVDKYYQQVEVAGHPY